MAAGCGGHAAPDSRHVVAGGLPCPARRGPVKLRRARTKTTNARFVVVVADGATLDSYYQTARLYGARTLLVDDRRGVAWPVRCGGWWLANGLRCLSDVDLWYRGRGRVGHLAKCASSQ